MIAIIDYSAGNIHSVKNAFEYIGQDCVVTNDAKTILRATRIVLPGVGAFADAINSLKKLNLIEPIKECIQRDIPFLGICLGMQMLFENGFEHGETQGLGVFRGEVVLFDINEKIPHMGYNSLNVKQGSLLTQDSYVYFIHSYHAVNADECDILSTTFYGHEFISAVKKNNVVGCQFHPEKSGDTGLNILRRFCKS